MIDDSTTYLQPQQSGLALLLPLRRVCVCVSIFMCARLSCSDREYKSARLCVRIFGTKTFGECSHASVWRRHPRCSSHMRRRDGACCVRSNISQACDKLRAHPIQGLLKKAQNVNGLPPHTTGFLSCGSNQR